MDKKAVKAAAIAAVVIGAIHYAAHTWIAPLFPKTNPIIVVSIVVVGSVFGLVYWKMTK